MDFFMHLKRKKQINYIKYFFFITFFLLIFFACTKNTIIISKDKDYELTSQWIMYGNDIGHSNKIKAHISPPLKMLWKKERTASYNFSPVGYYGYLYISLYDNKLSAIKLADGSTSWEFLSNEKITTTPLILENFIFFGDEKGSVYCINSFNGKVIWRKETKGGFFGSAIMPDGFQIYNGSLSGWIYNYEVEDGNIKWGVKIKSPIKTSFALDDDLLYVAAYDSSVYAINNSKHDIIWKSNLDGNLDISPAMDEKNVYIAVSSKGLYALDKSKGTIVWKMTVDKENITGAIALSENGIYLSAEKAVYLIEKHDGKIRWKKDMISPCAPIITDRVLFVGDSKGNLHAYNKERGNLYWIQQITQDKILGMIISEEKLIIWTDKELQVWKEEKK